MQPTCLLIQIEMDPAVNQRLDEVLIQAIRKQGCEISRSLLKDWFRNKKIIHKGTPIRASTLLSRGLHEITIEDFSSLQHQHLPQLAAPAPQGCFLPILYEDSDLLILNKKAGVPSIPHDPNETETAVGAALAHLPELQGIGRGGLEPAILHRLDTGTSGLIAFAKTEEEFKRVSACWKSGEVKKFYRALCSGERPPSLKHLPLHLNTPLAHNAKSSKKMILFTDHTKMRHRGKPLPASTFIHRVQELRSNSSIHPDLFGSRLLDLTIEIKTGVMHQIRCHLASLDLPILGDKAYQGEPSSRLWLHAWRLELPLKTGVQLTLESKIPWKFLGNLTT